MYVKPPSLLLLKRGEGPSFIQLEDCKVPDSRGRFL